MIQSEIGEEDASSRTAIVLLCSGGAAPAIADLLSTLGCDIASSTGEDPTRISAFNDDLLTSSGASANDWRPFNRRWLASPKAAEFLDRAIELLQAEFGKSYLFVMQDRSMARLLPFWNAVFDRVGVIPRYFFVLSDPGELAQQLHNQLGIDASIGHLIWLRTALEAEANSRGRLRAFATTAQLRDDTVGTIVSAAESLSLVLPRDVRATLAAEQARLKQFRDLRGATEPTANSQLEATADWVVAIQQVLNEYASSGETSEGLAILEAVGEAFDEAAPVFVGLAQSAAAKSARLTELEQELKALQSKLQCADVTATQAEVAAKQTEAALKGRISHLESEIAQRRAEVDETEQLLNEARREATAMRDELEMFRNAARTELAQLREDAAEKARSLEDARHEADSLRTDLDHFRSVARSEIDQLRESNAEKTREIVTLTRMLSTESAAARRLGRSTERLGAIADVLRQRGAKGGALKWFGWMVPWRWQLKTIKRTLERERLFDGRAYLAANPDVQSAGVDPLRHYLTHGAAEGRPLGID